MDALLASITRLQGDNVVQVLQALLQQAQVALKPANKPSKSRPPLLLPSPPVDKRNLALGILALLQHSCKLEAAPGNLNGIRGVVVQTLSDAMMQQPWMLELFARRHLEELLQSPGAVEILFESLTLQDRQIQSRSWAVLAGQLHQASPATISNAPALESLQRAALAQVSGCLRLSHDLMPALPAGLEGSAAEVHVTPTLQLPAALYVLLHLVAGLGTEGDVAPRGERACIEGASAYASTLIAELCNPAAVHRMVQLGNLQENRRDSLSRASESGGPVEPRMNYESAQRVHAAMHAATVLIEAVLTWPQLAARADGASEYGETDDATQMAMVGSLLALRWELAQLLAAVGMGRNLAKTAPPPWSLRTCTKLLDAMLLPGIAGQPDMLTMPPAIVAHAIEVMRTGLPTWSETRYAGSSHNPPSHPGPVPPAAEGIVFPLLLEFLQRVMKLQVVCYTGLLTPHAAVHAGAAYLAATSVARQLHSLLLTTAPVDQQQGANAILPHTIGGSNTTPGSKKRGAASPAESKRKKKGSAAVTQDDAVAEVMRLLATVPDLTQGDIGKGISIKSEPNSSLDPNHSRVLSSEQTANRTLVTSHPGQPVTAAGGAGRVSPSQTLAQTPLQTGSNASDVEKKPARRRIVPEAIGPAAAATATPASTTSNAAATTAAATTAAAPVDDRGGDPGASTSGAVPTRGTIGRVVMTSSLDMDDSAREAMWQAYIADKERLVEMLGDSSYQEWYDEASHPVPAATNTNFNNVDAAFDAIFGRAGDATAGDEDSFASSLPQTILETSILYPWQAALAAVIELAHATAETATASAPAAAQQVYSQLATVEQRKASLTAVLKVMIPDYGRNMWQTACKGIETLPASGTLLHFISQLQRLLRRTSRHTAPCLLSAYLHLACEVLTIAEPESSAAMAAARNGSSRKAPWQPLDYVGQLVRNFSCYPPLLAASFECSSARALPRLAAAGFPAMDAVFYSAGLLWLLVQPTAGPQVSRPDWLMQIIPEARSHPLIAATPAAKAAAVTELLAQLAIAEEVIKSAAAEDLRKEGRNEHEGDDSSMALLPLIDACAAAVMCFCREREREAAAAIAAAAEEGPPEASQPGAPPSGGPGSSHKASNAPSRRAIPAVLLGSQECQDALASFSVFLCSVCTQSAEELASALDTAAQEAGERGPPGMGRGVKARDGDKADDNHSDSDSDTESDSEFDTAVPALMAIKFRARLLNIGLELSEILGLLLSESLSSLSSGPGMRLSEAVEMLTGAQNACLELLRVIPEDSRAYLAVVQGLESAPVLSVPQECPKGDGNADKEGTNAAAGNDNNNNNNSESDEGGSEHDLPGKRSAYQRRKRLHDIQNPYLRVIVAESRRAAGDAADGDISDLEDFIVTNPERDYAEFVTDHFPMAPDSDADEEESEDEDEDSDDE